MAKRVSALTKSRCSFMFVKSLGSTYSSKYVFLYDNRNFSIPGQPDILYAHYGNLARRVELCVTYNPPGETVPGIYNFVSDFFRMVKI